MSNPNPTPGGPPLRALAMVLIALAIVFAGLGAMSLSNSDASATSAEGESTAASSTTQAAPTTPSTTQPSTTTTATPTTTTATTTTSAAAPTTASGVDQSVPVRVLNNSLVMGLAARTAAELTGNGWSNVTTGNYNGENLTTTTVFYGSGAGEKAAATAIASQIGGVAAPKNGDASTGVVVVLTGK
ncbi:LytR C-terminal domain-containing protein [Nocardia camponoti]|uniref:LytR/CpsA/Psr regulator C-terminal domain-containing protein n=1 Tax=Nocardia camponoti TaxID=1616106 RepID=A0A917QIC9_9NOCA|nr:LytR C-terminal domain-containing protein [Nocardia camponoti]GGK51743.1 hypothetical protein GCM10011591_24290 [Nocardia camponoti]